MPQFKFDRAVTKVSSAIETVTIEATSKEEALEKLEYVDSNKAIVSDVHITETDYTEWEQAQ